MFYLAPSTSSLQSTEGIGNAAISAKSQRQSPHAAPIHILDDDSLLNIFYLYRPAVLDGDEDGFDRLRGGRRWNRELWWYKLAQVCQRWRNLILGSPSYLDLCLVCTHNTPVADMLAHSPPLPLVIDYNEEDCDITSEDEEGIILALGRRDRVRRIRLQMPIAKLQKLNMAIDKEYPVLEYFIMIPSTEGSEFALMLPETLQAPHLHHVMLEGFVFPRGSRLLTTAVGLVTLILWGIGQRSHYFPPNVLLQWISFMPQLETLLVLFLFPVPNHDVEGQLIHTPTITHVTLPNLRNFGFKGVSAYMEAVVRRITAPRLDFLSIQLFHQLPLSVPHLLRFINTTEKVGFDSAEFEFSRDEVHAEVLPREKHGLSLAVYVSCSQLDWQVSSVAQIFNSLIQISSTVEHLTLKREVHSQSSEAHNEVDRTGEWHNFLRLFTNVKTLRVDDGLVGELSCSLRVDDGEPHLELLPELLELTYSWSGDADDAFTSFIDARQNAGRTVTAVRPSPRSMTPPSWLKPGFFGVV